MTAKSFTSWQFYDPMRDILEATKAFQLHDPMRDILEATKAFQLHDPMRDILEAMKAFQLHDPMRDILEAMKAQFHDPMQSLQAAMKALRLDRVLDAVSKEKWPLAYENLVTDFTINSDSTITVDGQTLTYDEIQEIVSQVVERAVNQLGNHFDQVIEGIAAEVRDLKSGVLAKVLTWVIFPLIINLITPVFSSIFDFSSKQVVTTNRRQVEKQIRRYLVGSIENREHLKNYRLVSSDILNVRSKPSQKAPILGQLHFGRIVVLIKKSKRWSLVVWVDDENEVQLQGWVFSRHLRNFR